MSKNPAVEATENDSVKQKKVRITLECSPATRKAIRILAAQQDKSMNDFIISTLMEQMDMKS